jgi:two-component system sensor histidine kinase ChvG
MASVTDIAKAEVGEASGPVLGRRLSPTWPYTGSRLGRLIIVLNLLALLILIGGSLVLNELGRGLIRSRLDSLEVQAELIANVIAELDTHGDPEPALEPEGALLALQKTFVPKGQRARLFDIDGNVLADSYLISNDVEISNLPPLRRRGIPFATPHPNPVRDRKRLAEARKTLMDEVHGALRGQIVKAVRRTDTGERVVSVAIPVQRVKGVVGALVLEAGGVDKIVTAQREEMAPFILVALGVSLFSSILLHLAVVRPIQRLSAAADQVRLSRARAISLPDLEARNDELGDLARSLETMTETLSSRMDAIERFAADVSHELKNPLTSVRSAVETLELVRDDRGKSRLMALLKQDVRRMDRLITDISNASRLDAELSREQPRSFNVARLIEEIVSTYAAAARPGEAQARFVNNAETPLRVTGREGPLGQVFRNLIDNARSFSPAKGEVRIAAGRDLADPVRPIVISVEDDGPGVPEENLETIFERFYTSRPQGTAFGGASGLGLSIARQIVQAHGGHIWAENRVGEDGKIKGARFVVALPEAKV